MKPTVQFGDPARFAVTVGWVEDPEPAARDGWSMGVLGLEVHGHSLTRHLRAEGEQAGVTWYLLPVFAWLCENWIALLHEERFAWLENGADSAAQATFFRLRRLIDARDPAGRAAYRACRSWWMRHALRAADASALYPDVFFRRFGDDIEVSWTARQPDFAPGGFRFVLEPGAATLPVAEVAGPLWEALNWFVSTAPASARDRGSMKRLDTTVAALRGLPSARLEAGFLSDTPLERIREARAEGQFQGDSVRMRDVPVIERLDDPVLMFGGVSPEIGASDAKVLLGLLADRSGGTEAPALSGHVDANVGPPLAAPFEEGYDLAESLLDAMDLPEDGTSCIAIEQVIAGFGIELVERALDTDTIRGVAIAGDRYAPAILVNTTSPYNATETGRRFTLAHELFHVLYDRARSRRVAHTSGPWAAPGVEKRANAFAAMFLMPGALVRRTLHREPWAYADVAAAADAMKVGPGALIEHLYNVDLIDVAARERLRADVQPSAGRRDGRAVRRRRTS